MFHILVLLIVEIVTVLEKPLSPQVVHLIQSLLVETVWPVWDSEEVCHIGGLTQSERYSYLKLMLQDLLLDGLGGRRSHL